MKPVVHRSLVPLIICVLYVLSTSAVAAQSGGAAGTLHPSELIAEPGVRVLKWENLVPPGYSADELVGKYAEQTRNLSDDDPRAKKIIAQLQEAWASAPVVESLNGKLVKLPGYAVPLEGDGKSVSAFLLVPFFGACIHVPPPPSNQIVSVRAGANVAKISKVFDVVWVTGRMRTERTKNELATAGYVIEATKVEPYK